MSFWDSVKRFFVDEVPLNDTSVKLDDVLLQALLNGETITREKALTLPVVSSAVDLISGTVASMPIKLYRYKKGDVAEVANDTRVKILNGDTGDTLNAFEMKKAMVEDYLLGQGGYAVIQRDRNTVVALKYVQDIYVSVYQNADVVNKYVNYLIGTRYYKNYEVLRLLRNTKNGADGVGLIDEVGKALETAYSTLLYQLGLVQSGGNKKGFLQSERKLAQEEIDKLKEAWRNLYANNTSNVVVLNNGLKFQESSSTSVEMQLNDSKKTLQDEINSVFHIYPNDFSRTFKEAIYPIIKAFETSLNSTLLLESEKRNYFFELDVKEIVRADLKERYEAYRLAKETGFMTLNEIRKEENMNYIEGLDVINVGLSAVLYDVNTHQYYTPNTGTLGTTAGNAENEINQDEDVTEQKGVTESGT